MDKTQETIDRAASILEQVAEPTFQHTNRSGALFVEASKIIFKAAGVSGFNEAQEAGLTEDVEG